MSDRQLQELAAQVGKVRGALEEIGKAGDISADQAGAVVSGAGIALVGILGGIARDLNRIADALEGERQP